MCIIWSVMVCSYKNTMAKSFDRDGFQIVKHKRRYQRVHKTTPPTHEDYTGSSTLEIIARVTEYRKTILESQFYHKLCALLRDGNPPPYSKVVCYGIGHIGTCSIAQQQFALLLELVQYLDLTCSLFDPVLHNEELAAVQSSGCQILPTNELCRHTVNQPTVFFMPHCGRAMYNNLLWANWSMQRLTNVTVIGNSFQNYTERVPTKQLETEARYISKIAGVCCEHPLPTCYHDNTVFNDLSLHTFPHDRLLSLPSDVWSNPPEPSLDPQDPEMIIN